jgi:hypothetical protein
VSACVWLHRVRVGPRLPVAVVFRGNARKPLYISVKASKTGTVAGLKMAIQDLKPGLYGTGPTTPGMQVPSLTGTRNAWTRLAKARACCLRSQSAQLERPLSALCHLAALSTLAAMSPHPLRPLPRQVHADDLYVCRQYREGGLTDEVPDETPLSQIKESDQVVVFQLPPLSGFQLQAPEAIQVHPVHRLSHSWSLLTLGSTLTSLLFLSGSWWGRGGEGQPHVLYRKLRLTRVVHPTFRLAHWWTRGGRVELACSLAW